MNRNPMCLGDLAVISKFQFWVNEIKSFIAIGRQETYDLFDASIDLLLKN